LLVTRIVQAVLFVGVGSLSVLAVRVFIDEVRHSFYLRDNGLDRDGFKIPIDYDGEIRRKTLTIGRGHDIVSTSGGRTPQ
jgi:hypothetical protein